MSQSDISTIDSTLRLRDGRVLGYMEAGKPDGPPIFHFHGHGSSRLEVSLLAESAATSGVRVIALDRPGIGRSDARWNFQILDWPADVVEAADQLGIGRFAIEGVSAGGIYAMACAYKIPHRLTACGLISTTVPPMFVKQGGPRWMQTTWWAAEHLSWLFQPSIHLRRRMIGSDVASIEKWLASSAPKLGEGDQKVIANPEIRAHLGKIFAESYRQGEEANLKELEIGVRSWGFEAEQITFENMYLWHGEQDRIIPVEPVRLLAQALPHCNAIFYPDEGHFSTVINHSSDILQTLSAES